MNVSDSGRSRLTAREQKERRLAQKRLVKAMKRTVVGTPWRAARYFVYCRVGSWFVYVRPVVWLDQRRTTAELYVKPMEMDRLFWDIVDLPGNNELPLSFRADGAWTCMTPAYREEGFADVDASEDVVASEILQWSMRMLDDIADLSLEGWFAFMQGAPKGNRFSYFSTVFISLMMLGRWSEAYAYCLDAEAERQHGGFTIGSGDEFRSFVGLARRWLEARPVMSELH